MKQNSRIKATCPIQSHLCWGPGDNQMSCFISQMLEVWAWCQQAVQPDLPKSPCPCPDWGAFSSQSRLEVELWQSFSRQRAGWMAYLEFNESVSAAMSYLWLGMVMILATIGYYLWIFSLPNTFFLPDYCYQWMLFKNSERQPLFQSFPFNVNLDPNFYQITFRDLKFPDSIYFNKCRLILNSV